jgi:hypothetical protein
LCLIKQGVAGEQAGRVYLRSGTLAACVHYSAVTFRACPLSHNYFSTVILKMVFLVLYVETFNANAVAFLRKAIKNDSFSHASLYHRAFDQWFLTLRGATGVNARDLEPFLEACRRRNIRNTRMSEFQQNMILEAWLEQDGGGAR